MQFTISLMPRIKFQKEASQGTLISPSHQKKFPDFPLSPHHAGDPLLKAAGGLPDRRPVGFRVPELERAGGPIDACQTLDSLQIGRNAE